VGLNKPVTKGEMILQQAQEQGVPPEQLQQLQMQIQQDPSMQQNVSTENDIIKLDVDIVIADAPDSISTQIEDFQVIGEMVKSGFQMPPLAVIEASPLSNKDKIIKMMKEAPQQSPEHQKQMEDMQNQMETLQQESQKLAQENQQLKMGAQESQMKIEASMQESQMKLEAKKQESVLEMQMKAEIQAQELQLEREKAIANMELEREKMAFEREKAQADLDLQGMKMQMEQDNKSKTMAFDQQCRMEDMTMKTEQENKVEGEKVMPKVMNELNSMASEQKAFQDNVINLLNAKKTITMKSPSGEVYKAVKDGDNITVTSPTGTYKATTS